MSVGHCVDASFVLAIVLDEQVNADSEQFLSGALISAVNLSEVYRKLVDGGMEIDDAVGTVSRFDLESIAFDDPQAAEAARLRPLTRHLGLSFADRACLALIGLRDIPVYTADRDWAELDLGLDIRLIR